MKEVKEEKKKGRKEGKKEGSEERKKERKEGRKEKHLRVKDIGPIIDVVGSTPLKVLFHPFEPPVAFVVFMAVPEIATAPSSCDRGNDDRDGDGGGGDGDEVDAGDVKRCWWWRRWWW